MALALDPLALRPALSDGLPFSDISSLYHQKSVVSCDLVLIKVYHTAVTQWVTLRIFL